MTLSDPTSGAGYAFGEQLPSSHMTTVATQQPYALDVVNGGSYTMTAAVTVDVDDYIWTLTTGGSGAVYMADNTPVVWRGSSTTDVPQVQVRTYEFHIPLMEARENTSIWAFQNTTNTWVQSDGSDPGWLLFAAPRMPPGNDITNVSFRVDGDGGGSGYAGSPPTTLPEFVFRVRGVGSGSPSDLDTVTDGSGDISTYNSVHSIDGTVNGAGPYTQAVSSSSLLWVEFNGADDGTPVNNALQILSGMFDVSVIYLTPPL